MKRVVAAIDNSAAAEAAGVPLRTLGGAPADALVELAGDEDVAAVVVGARASPLGRRPVGRTALGLITRVSKPVVVVPPHAHVGPVSRMLVPLDGRRASALGVADPIARARAHGVEVVLAHVREERSVPRFSEQPQHETQAWSDEFLARHCERPDDATLELRMGVPSERILRLVDETRSTLLVLAWRRVLAPDRGEVVRQALAHASVPILLVPEPAPDVRLSA